MKSKLAILFPGIGYHKDKPLLYYAGKLARTAGYEVMSVAYHDIEKKLEDPEVMKKGVKKAYAQVEEQLSGVNLADYDDILFIGKSIGTIVLAKYASDHDIKAKQIWYTPLTATFTYAQENIIAFIGDEDPCSDYEDIKKLADKKKVALYTYPGCNHSLESGDVLHDIKVLASVMDKTEEYINETYSEVATDERVASIESMEKIYDTALDLLNGAKENPAALRAYQPEIRKLAEYYESPLWKEDFEADEDGMLPKDLKRGVLSEDGIYNLLDWNSDIMKGAPI